MATIKYEAASAVTLLDTELNSLANSAGAIDSGSYDNATNLYMFGAFELTVDFASASTANAMIDLYLIPAIDGTNFVDNVTGSSEFAPLDSYVGGFQCQNTANAQRIGLWGAGGGVLIPLPPVPFKAFVINNSGQAFPASGSVLKMVPYRYQVV